MEYGINQRKEMVNIVDYKESDTYTCPVCGEKMIAKFGTKKQYFSHTINKDNNCDLKMKNMTIVAKNICKVELIENSKNVLDLLYNNCYNDDITEINGLSEEQYNIINSNEKRIKILAKSGTGKSFTCMKYLSKRPDVKKLYIVFNKKMADEATEIFHGIPNLEIRTTYSLAYKFVGFKYKHKLTTTDLNIFNYAKAMDMYMKNAEQFQLVDMVASEFERFISSDCYSVEEFCVKNGISSEIKKHMNVMFYNWKDLSSDHKITHAFYLKLWQISKPDLSDYCDILCLDEGQDVSESLASIIENCKVDTVLTVGDFYQELYNFANPVSGFKNIAGVEYPLSICFRVGNTLAKLNSKIFQHFENKEFNFIGYNKSQKIVEKINTTSQYVKIYRSNYAIVMDMLNELKNNKTFYVEGKNGKINTDMIKRIYDFKYTNNEIHYSLKQYKNYEGLKKVIGNKNTPIEVKSAFRIVEELGEDTLNILHKLEISFTDRSKADIIYSTTHQAKGTTISLPVKIGDDFLNIDTLDLTFEDWEVIKYELYILYVALTRCKKEIELSSMVLNWYIMFYDKHFK